jgi:flagellar hook protein FlgE
MSLASVLQTATSGMSAATFALDVASNNLANSRTNGFKQSRPVFTTQPSSMRSIGTAPSTSNGGTNPIQSGNGVRVASVTTDFSQGSLAISSDPLDIALQGAGLFIVEGPSGERSYTRSGEFQLNASDELITASGERVLGYGVDENFQVDDSQLQPLTIQLGSPAEGADGSAATLTGFSIASDGRIHGEFSDGTRRDLGQVRIARFGNPTGLQARGGNLFQPGPNSGLPVESNPGDAGSATLVASAVETSNTDIGRNLVEVLLASKMFGANAAVFGAADQMLDDLLNLRRHSG